MFYFQQMKDEINSDIASFVSDQEYSDYDETDSQSWTEEEYMEEEEDEGEYEEDEYDESDDESVFYEDDNTDEIEPNTSVGVRSSQSIDSEYFVQAEENINASQEISVVVDDIFDEPFEAILPPAEFTDEKLDSDDLEIEAQPIDSILTEIQQKDDDHIEEQNQNILEETIRAVKSRQSSVESEYDEDSESEQSQDNSDESEESVENSEFENIKRNSVDLQENALFIQQELNKATTIVVAKSSTELRDEISPTVELVEADSTLTSEDAIEEISTQSNVNEDMLATENTVTWLEATARQEEEIEAEEEELPSQDESATINQSTFLENEETEETAEESMPNTLDPNNLVQEMPSVASYSIDSAIYLERTASNNTEIEIVIPDHEVNTLPMISTVEKALNTEVAGLTDTIEDDVMEANTVQEASTSTSTNMVSSMKPLNDDEEAGTSTSSSLAAVSNKSDKISELPTSSKQTQPPKQAKITTKTTKKIPVRKASLALSGPFGSIRTNNVRAMQQELLSKSTTKPLPSKPSKIVPPKVYTKASITSLTERITKFIKPFSNASTSKEASSSSVVKNVIPKKKYHETCFSDDNPTSDEEPMPIRRQVPIRQQSMPNIMESQLPTEEEETPEVRSSMHC